MKFKNGFPIFLKLLFMLPTKTLRYVLTLLLLSLMALCFYPVGWAGELKIALQDDPDMLDPALSKTFSGCLVYMAKCDRLVDLSQDMQFILGRVKNWNFSEDGKILEMNLRKNVFFMTLHRSMLMPPFIRKSGRWLFQNLFATMKWSLSRILRQQSFLK